MILIIILYYLHKIIMNSNMMHCYFCDLPYVNDSFQISNINGIIICYNCEEFDIFGSIINNIISNIECPVCFETKNGVKLFNFNHKICIDCCKYVYSNQKPKKNTNNYEYIYNVISDILEKKITKENLNNYLVSNFCK